MLDSARDAIWARELKLRAAKSW